MWLGDHVPGRLLDVGCGNGGFIARMRHLGWNVSGIEPDAKAATVAEATVPGAIHVGTIADAPYPTNAFDAITLSHVLEHVSDPIGLLDRVRNHLKPGGIVVALTPNVRSLGRKVFGPAWRGWEPPRHFFVFSLDTLRRCVETAGLEVAELRTISRAASYFWITSRQARRSSAPLHERTPSGWLRVEGQAFSLLESILLKRFPVGEELLVLARPPMD
jgi:SAM-dependent methyltransferase